MGCALWAVVLVAAVAVVVYALGLKCMGGVVWGVVCAVRLLVFMPCLIFQMQPLKVDLKISA